MFMVGHNASSQGFNFATVDNTKLWYVQPGINWYDLSEIHFGISGNGIKDWGYESSTNFSSRWSNLTSNYAKTEHTSNYDNYSFDNSYYYISYINSSWSIGTSGVPTRTVYLRVKYDERDGNGYGNVISGSTTWSHGVTFDFTGTCWKGVDGQTKQTTIENLTQNSWEDSGTKWGYENIPFSGEVTFELKDIDTGFELEGWAEAENATSPTYTPVDPTNVTFNVTTSNNTISYVAMIRRKQYTVTLNDNNGSGGSGSVTTTYDKTTNLTSRVTIPTRAGYTFCGYYTNNDGTGSKVIGENGAWIASVDGYTGVDSSDPKWIRDGSVTLYAKWLENCYSFTPKSVKSDETISTGDVLSTSVGGEMKATTAAGLKYSTNGLFFGNGTDEITVTLNNRLQAGSFITLQMKAGSTSVVRGYVLKTASGSTVSTLSFDPAIDQNNTLAYTVVADDGLEGEYEFRIVRTGGNMNLKGVTVSNCGDAMYIVTNTLTNVTKTSGGSKAGGENYTAVYAANSGYVLPATIVVTIGGAAAIVDDDYTWDPTTGALTIENASITDEVGVTITGLAVNYSFVSTTTSGYLAVDDTPATSTGGTMTVVGVGTATSLAYNSSGLYFTNGADSVKVTLSGKNMQTGSLIYATIHENKGNKGFALRDAGGTEITPAPFKWNKATEGYETRTFLYVVSEDDGLEGNNVFKLQRHGNTYLKSIYVANCADRYSVTHTLTNVTKTSGGDYAGGKDYTAVYSVGTGYTLPTSITVTISGVAKTVDTDYTWDDETGTVTIPKANLTGAVVITVVTDPNEYTITYKDQGDISYQGSNSESLLTTHTYDSETNLVDGVRSGYEFLGWYENSACTGSPVATLGATDYTDDITLYAKWGKTVSQNDFYKLYSTSDVTDADALIAVAGFPEYITTTFDKKYWWGNGQFRICSIDVPHDYTGMTSGGNRAYLTFNSSTKTVTLRAVKNVKAVRFYGWNNDTGLNISTTATLASGSGSAPIFSDVAISGTNALVAEHIIYISTTNGSTARTNYSDEAYYDLTFTFGGGSWLGMYVETNEEVTLSYDANGGSGAPSAEDNWAPNETNHLSSTAPTRSNYLFAGWNTESDGSGDSYAAGGAYTMPLTAKTLYAQWVQPICQNNFYQLYGNEKTSAAALIAAAGFPSYITTTFSGYSAWGGYTPLNEDVPHDFTAMSGYYDFLIANDYETITLHNVANIKAVHFYGWDKWSDHNIVTSVTKKNATGAPTIANVPVTQEDGVLRHYVVHVSTTDGSTARANYSASDVYDLTFTFQNSTWIGMYVETNTVVTLTYDANGGTGAPDAESWAPNATDHLSSTEPTRDGYEFAGWNEEEDGSGTTTYNADGVYTMPLSNTTLYAQWTPVTLSFSGTTDSDWSKAANWSPACVPTIEHDVVITKPVEVNVTDARAKSVVLDQYSDNTGSLTISAGKELAIAGTLRKKDAEGATVATAAADITIGSDEDGNGALVMGTHDGTNEATVNFYTLSHGAKNSSESVNQYIGIPFTEATILSDYYNSWMYKIGYDADDYPYWVRITNGNETLNPFVGYSLISADGAGHVYEMSGTLVATTNRSLSLVNNVVDAAVNEKNENLLANSWTAPIKIDSMKTTDFTNAIATIYIFNSGSPNDAEDDKTLAGQYSTYPIASAEGAVIPSMQSFSVYSTGSSASVSLNYERLVYSPAVASTAAITPNKVRRDVSAVANSEAKLRIYVQAESGYSDMVYMREREDFAEGFENGYDGHKIFGESVAPQLYAVTPDGNMAVNCVPDLEGTILGFKAATSDSCTITFEYDEAEALYLLDTQTGTYTRVETDGSYRFGVNKDDVGAHNRFVLTRYTSPQTPTGVEQPTPDPSLKGRDSAHKFMNDNKMFILYRGVLYDGMGKRVEERRAQQ